MVRVDHIIMSFRGQPYAFESPAAAIAGMVARLERSRSTELAESCALDRAIGRVLAEAVVADRDSPPFDTSAMDGYAVRVADLAGEGASITLPIVGESRIGMPPPVLPSGAGAGAIRIVTGAAIPPGADAVIRREDVEERTSTRSAPSAGVATIALSDAARRVARGAHIRHRGENARAGDRLLEAGTVLSASSIGALAACGCAAPRVITRQRVGVIVTGDELVPIDAQPDAFQLRDSNGSTLHATLAAHAWLEVLAPEHAVDEGARVEALLRARVEACDVVVLSGGVSMGHRDPVRAAIEAIGADIVFHGLPQRPGKPMLGAIARRADGRSVVIFALPGNPISAMVTARRIVVPVLAALTGARMAPRAPRVTVANADDALLDLWWHRLVRITDAGEAELVAGRGSGDIVAGGHSDGFIEVPPRTRSEGSFQYFAWAV